VLISELFYVVTFPFSLSVTDKNIHGSLLSGPAWIRVDSALLDPDLHRECGSGCRNKEINQNPPDFQPFKKAFALT
jgi:hypothetical protein